MADPSTSAPWPNKLSIWDLERNFCHRDGKNRALSDAYCDGSMHLKSGVATCNSPRVMVASAYERAKRAFVSLLLSLARSYGLVLDLCRASDDLVAQRAYRRVLLKVHPDGAT